jgi:hypothetical protein
MPDTEHVPRLGLQAMDWLYLGSGIALVAVVAAPIPSLVTIKLPGRLIPNGVGSPLHLTARCRR